ncbi:MAG: S41 family peptidase [Clostridia bacterium]|nr:S41 family peptidase [Clostridia bacterium]MBR6006202.1 S41 family peptidase [Clostridia bacterium]
MMNEYETEQPVREAKKRSGKGASAWQVAVLMLLSALLAAVIVVAVLALGGTRYTIVDTKDSEDLSVLNKLLHDVKNYYYFTDELPASDELIDAAAQGLVDKVGDPYADYYSRAEYEDFRQQLSGNFKGIGVLISQDERGAYVQRVYEDAPAAKAGMQDGDCIVAVNGSSVAGMELGAISDIIGGEDGTVVRLTVLRGEETLDLNVTRGDVYVRRVYTERLGNGIGYLRIDSFTGNAAAEFNDAIDGFLKMGMEGLVIDLRNNPGGMLETVVAICDRILPECTITTIEGKLVNPPKVYTSSAKESIDIPIVVLTNGNSASASEIFAAAIKENHAGVIMGTNTFGKGIVQTSWQLLPGKGYLKLTTDVYKTPNGNMIHGVGVAPDIELAQDPEIEGYDIYYIRRDMKDRDVQVNAAIEYLLGLHD